MMSWSAGAVACAIGICVGGACRGSHLGVTVRVARICWRVVNRMNSGEVEVCSGQAWSYGVIRPPLSSQQLTLHLVGLCSTPTKSHGDCKRCVVSLESCVDLNRSCRMRLGRAEIESDWAVAALLGRLHGRFFFFFPQLFVFTHWTYCRDLIVIDCASFCDFIFAFRSPTIATSRGP